MGPDSKSGPTNSPAVLHKRIIVEQVLSGRYAAGTRPVSWDDRRDGFERVKTAEGHEVELYSSGGQSTPGPNWELMLGSQVGADAGKTAFQWTLYGIKQG